MNANPLKDWCAVHRACRQQRVLLCRKGMPSTSKAEHVSQTPAGSAVEYGHWLLSLGLMYLSNRALQRATAAAGIAFPSPLIGELQSSSPVLLRVRMPFVLHSPPVYAAPQLQLCRNLESYIAECTYPFTLDCSRADRCCRRCRDVCHHRSLDYSLQGVPGSRREPVGLV